MRKVKIFLSYPNRDVRLAHRLEADLKEAGRAVGVQSNSFVAKVAIRMGENWEKAIRDALSGADVVLFVWTKGSFSSVGQLVELGACWFLDKTRIGICYGLSCNALPAYIDESQGCMWADRHGRLRDLLRSYIN